MAIHAAYFPLCLASIACLCPLALLLESSSFPLRYPTDQSDSTFESGGLSSPGCRCCGPSRNNNNNVDDDNNNVKNKKKTDGGSEGMERQKRKKNSLRAKKGEAKRGREDDDICYVVRCAFLCDEKLPDHPEPHEARALGTQWGFDCGCHSSFIDCLGVFGSFLFSNKIFGFDYSTIRP